MSVKIPKVIHYCWFSGEEKPKSVAECIDSWRDKLKDYEIIEWNTSNFDVNCNAFVKEAYNAGKWAFAADYFRTWVMYHYGGIYLDADVYVKKSFDDYLDNEIFIPFEDDALLGPHVIGSLPGRPMFKYIMELLENRKFTKDDGTYDMVVLPTYYTAAAIKYYGLALSGRNQKIGEAQFCGYNFFSVEMNDGNCIAEHKFLGGWTKDKCNTFVCELKRTMSNLDKVFSLYKLKHTIRCLLIRSVSQKRDRVLIICSKSDKKRIKKLSKTDLRDYNIHISALYDNRRFMLIDILKLYSFVKAEYVIDTFNTRYIRFSNPLKIYLPVSDVSCLVRTFKKFINR